MPARSVLRPFVALLRGVVAAAVLATAAAASPIRNTATLTYETPAGLRTITSNSVTIDPVAPVKRPTSLGFRQIPAGYGFPNLACTGAAPMLDFHPGDVTAKELAAAAPLVSRGYNEASILVLDNEGGNHDPTVREEATIDVAFPGVTDDFKLLETGPDTGVFAGALPAIGQFPQTAACDAAIPRGAEITLSFHEDQFSYSSTATLIVDPEGYVFDSLSGEPVNGAEITLIDAVTGEPARVMSQDGDPDFPARVVSGGMAHTGQGDRYVFRKGNFRFPLVPPGTYRLKIVPPEGYRGPSSRAADALTGLPAPVSGGYHVVEASYSEPFTVEKPAPLFVDVPLDRDTRGSLVLEKAASVPEASPGDFVQYRLLLKNTAASPASGVIVDDRLPIGLRYRSGSTRGAPEPLVGRDGRALRFTMPEVAADGSATLTYVVEVAPGAPVGPALNRATASDALGTASNEASASVRLRPLLFTDALTIVGRVTEGRCDVAERDRNGIPGIRVMLEDGTLVTTDKDGLYHFEGARPGTHVVQMDMRSLGLAYAPQLCGDDTRRGGNPLSRFVEGAGGSLQRADFHVRATGRAAEAEDALPITVRSDAEAAGNRPDWLAGVAPGIGWLFPEVDHNPRAPAVRVVLKHLPGQRVALKINGAQVDPLSFDGTEKSADGSVAVSRWTGLPLRDRDNLLEARVLDAAGTVVETLTRTVHYSNVPVRAAYVPAASRLVADGIRRPLIAIRVLDRDGKPVRAGTVVPFTVTAPYQAAQDGIADKGRALANMENAGATARVVGDEGLAFAALAPTMQAGAVQIGVALTVEEVTQVSRFKAWLEPAANDWVVVGFGRGTLGYNRIRSKAEPLADGRDVALDGQLALYAKGRIKGSWLLTIAYDSDKRVDRDRALLGTIDPDRYYTVYGDGAQQSYDAATRRKLYLRLERRAFYALFGDFETGLVETKLARYSRTLTGVKTEYQGDRVSVTAFAANDDQLYARDEIQGNGLSGPYRLSARDIVPNSDKITLETRDRFRSEKIVDSVAMARHIDYDIDPIAGTIRFKQPILSRDKDRNPVFIVVDYETYGRSKKLAAGGRAALRIAGGRVELGASVLHDETFADATVIGLDAKAQVTRTTELRAEAATGGPEGIGKAQAGLVEVEHHGSRADVLAYARQQDTRYGVGQQNEGEAGTRKLGLEGRLRVTGRLDLTASGWYQNDLDGTARRAAGQARLEVRMDKGIAFLGLEGASDRGIGGTRRDSRLVTLGATRSFLDNRLELSAKTGFALGGDDASVDFPVRHEIGASWRFTDGIRLIAAHEIANGAAFKAHGTRIGFDVAPWAGARLTSAMNQQQLGENGARTFAQYGLNQSLPIGKRWTVDASLDASKTVKGQIPQGDIVNPFHPVASGGFLGQDERESDYTAATLGAAYRGTRWSWNGRVEYRTSSESRRWGVTSNVLRTLGEGKTIASSLRAYEVRNEDGRRVSFASADIALAWRPLGSRWALLERFELRHEAADRGIGPGNLLGVPAFASGDQTTLRAVNNLAVNYRAGGEGALGGIEATLYYGAKFVRGRYSDDVYEGFIDVIGAEIRKDIGARIDVGANAGMQHAWKSGAKAFSFGPSIGYSPADNLWITAGYNVRGYRDRDFEDARYTRQGPYVSLRMKFDQLSLGAAGRALKGIGR